MFKTLLLKEIHESILNFRFWLVSALCLLLIPFGLYIASKDYLSRLEEYKGEQEKFIIQTQGKINGSTEIEGFFPPSPLSILSSGFRDHLPSKVITSLDGFARTEKKLQDSNLQSVLFGRIDFVFIVTNFLSLLALIFTFGAVSSECEQGTLKLLLSNQLPRWKLILAKILGNYFVFLAPFIMSVIIGLLIVQWVAGVNFLILPWLPDLLFIMFFTLLFLFMFFNLGIWASVISNNTITSIVILLFIWIFFSLGIPRLCPMVAQLISPVKTDDAFRKDYQLLKQNIEDEHDKERGNLFKQLIKENNIEINWENGFPNFYEIAEKKTNYTQLIGPVDNKYKTKLSLELGNLERDYNQSKFHQMAIASNLSRISPVSSYTFLVTELSNTGILEYTNRQEAANKFQFRINQVIYSLYVYKKYVYEGLTTFGTEAKSGKWPTQHTSVPVMTEYNPVPFTMIIQKIWPDIILLIWYTIFFFTGALVSFLRFDVK
ncbi:MAG TPA: ABC transporter permease subunit [Bacteroidales bacterium]|nr:ABC transporter permease subunit [Bacteroidales bacterium]